MMRSKTHIGLAALLIAAILGVGHGVYALQDPPGPGVGPGPGGPRLPRLQQLAEQLDLTDAQKTQIQGVLENARSQLQTLRNDTTLTREQKMDQAQQITQQTRDQIHSVLTPDQQAKADELRQQAEERFGAQREKMEEQLLTRLTKQLDLTDSQKSTIQLYLQDQKTQLQALKDNTALTASQKFEQMQSIRQQTQEKIKSVLTAEQQTQLDQLREQMQDRRQGRRRGGRRGRPGGGGVQNQGFSL
ncbi:MAG: hypothetical protein HYX73_10455 [Acidobacteria bacterium]|nr:hypothetical protein [Acidobacteriota bacterium]